VTPRARTSFVLSSALAILLVSCGPSAETGTGEAAAVPGAVEQRAVEVVAADGDTVPVSLIAVVEDA
jgi:hypothetical protein